MFNVDNRKFHAIGDAMENEETRKLVIAGYEKLRTGQFKELSEMYAKDAVWISPVVEGFRFQGRGRGEKKFFTV